jgi:hypothetical protein
LLGWHFTSFGIYRMLLDLKFVCLSLAPSQLRHYVHCIDFSNEFLMVFCHSGSSSSK